MDQQETHQQSEPLWSWLYILAQGTWGGRRCEFGGFHGHEGSPNRWLMEHPLYMDETGGSPISGNLHTFRWIFKCLFHGFIMLPSPFFDGFIIIFHGCTNKKPPGASDAWGNHCWNEPIEFGIEAERYDSATPVAVLLGGIFRVQAGVTINRD